MARPAVEEVAEHHGGRTDQERRPEDLRDVRLRRLGVAQDVQEIRADEGHGHGAHHHPTDQAPVDRLLSDMYRGSERAHENGGHQIAGDGRRRLDSEEQDEHRGHQGPAAGPGHSDEQSHYCAAQHDVRIDLH